MPFADPEFARPIPDHWPPRARPGRGSAWHFGPARRNPHLGLVRVRVLFRRLILRPRSFSSIRILAALSSENVWLEKASRRGDGSAMALSLNRERLNSRRNNFRTAQLTPITGIFEFYRSSHSTRSKEILA